VSESLSQSAPATLAATQPAGRSLLRPGAAGWLVLLVVGIGFPLTQAPYMVELGAVALAYTVAICGLNLVTGLAGQVSLAHSFFVALGAYVAAILVQAYGWPFFATLPVSAAAAFIAGILVGAPAIRLSGLYLTVVTFAVALVVPPVIVRLEAFTGGANGLPITEHMVPEVLLRSDQWVFLIAFLFAAAAIYVLANLRDSAFGRGLQVLQANELAAQTLGLNPPRLKVLAFAVSGVFGGLAGSLLVLIDSFVAPQSFTFMLSILLLVGAVIGGIQSAGGALVGAIVLVALPQLTDGVGLGWVGVTYGLAIVVIILLVPKGAAGLGQAALRAVRKLARR
jgi:branched-chain amino acid transport system permease protein